MSILSFPSVRCDAFILILGLGETGVSAALWCAEHGASLRLVDTRSEPASLATLRTELKDAPVEWLLGLDVLTEDALRGVGQIVISPGLSPVHEPVKSFLAMAAERQIEVIGEIELFARALADMAPQGYRPRVLAITGTNGKTTVTVMARQLVQAAGITAQAAGNIGPAALTALRQSLAAGDLPDVWVLELSSFQLFMTDSLVPDVAAVLNVSQDHLDWHGSMQAYTAAKAKLLRMARLVVVNRDDPAVVAMVADMTAVALRSFGRAAAPYEGDLGIDDAQGVRWLSACEPVDFDVPVVKTKRGKAAAAPQRRPGRCVRLMPAEALKVRGEHNAMNALAALAMARALGIGWADMLRALRDYGGEPHRTEFLRTITGVDFVNDSKGTNVGATVAALEGLGQTVVLIAGGLGKGQDFSPLLRPVENHARAVVLIGADGPLIADALASTGVPIEQADSLDQAVARAFALAKAGDAVLLSPACASMDMFKNYGQRGSCFVQAVQELALDNGEVA